MSADIIVRKCVEKDCPNTFEITPSEQGYFQQNGLQLPKRCKPCRDRKRAEREKQASVGG